MGKPSPEEKERNIAIKVDYKLYLASKIKMHELVAKYKISSTRIHQIGKKE